MCNTRHEWLFVRSSAIVYTDQCFCLLACVSKYVVHRWENTRYNAGRKVHKQVALWSMQRATQSPSKLRFIPLALMPKRNLRAAGERGEVIFDFISMQKKRRGKRSYGGARGGKINLLVSQIDLSGNRPWKILMCHEHISIFSFLFFPFCSCFGLR